MRKVRLMILAILVLFAMPLVVNALPLENFAENPIPYWTDNSLDVNLTWDSTDQTVTIEDDTPYWDDMSDVSDWGLLTSLGIGGGDHSFTSDGNYATIGLNCDDAGDEYVIYSTEEADGLSTNLYAEIKYKAGSPNTYFHCYIETTGGNGFLVGSAVNTDWITEKKLLSDIAGIAADSVITRIRFYNDDLPNSFDGGLVYNYIDHIRVGEQELNVSVPIEPDTTQSVELMGNFSALVSTVRFQIYDDATASDLFCDVNATQVTFPDSTYAEFTDFARINFSLDAERTIFRIYVSAQNTTLINYYSYYEGLANKDSLRMNDSGFEGSFTLWYLQGDIGYLEVIDTENIFYLLFLSLEMWGYLGPIALVIIGFYLVEKSVTLGVLWFIVECLFVANYLDLVEATPHYWWHIMILLLGGLFTCIFPLIDRR